MAARQHKADYLAAKSKGIAVEELGEDSRLRLDDAIEQYFANLAAQGRDYKTIGTYRYAVTQFRESCSKTYLDQLTRQDMINFMGYLRRLPRTKRKRGDPNRTFYNKTSHVGIFLKAFGVPQLLKRREYPKYTPKPVSYYNAEEMRALFAAAVDAEERFVLSYFLKTGVRDGEAGHAEYTDIKDGNLYIIDKPHLSWHPKQHQIRTIPIPSDLIPAIGERRGRNPGTNLIFPTKSGRPDRHLLRVVQRIAERAGFEADLHTFRRTYATMLANEMKNVRVIQYLLGHKDLKTTLLYLGLADLNSAETRAALEGAFSKFPVLSDANPA
jgi:integrase